MLKKTGKFQLEVLNIIQSQKQTAMKLLNILEDILKIAAIRGGLTALSMIAEAPSENTLATAERVPIMRGTSANVAIPDDGAARARITVEIIIVPFQIEIETDQGLLAIDLVADGGIIHLVEQELLGGLAVTNSDGPGTLDPNLEVIEDGLGQVIEVGAAEVEVHVIGVVFQDEEVEIAIMNYCHTLLITEAPSDFFPTSCRRMNFIYPIIREVQYHR